MRVVWPACVWPSMLARVTPVVLATALVLLRAAVCQVVLLAVTARLALGVW